MPKNNSEIVKEALIELGPGASNPQVRDWVMQKYPAFSSRRAWGPMCAQARQQLGYPRRTGNEWRAPMSKVVPQQDTVAPPPLSGIAKSRFATIAGLLEGKSVKGLLEAHALLNRLSEMLAGTSHTAATVLEFFAKLEVYDAK